MLLAAARGVTVGAGLVFLVGCSWASTGRPDDLLVLGTAFLFGLAPCLSSYVELTQRGRGRTRLQLLPWALWSTVLAGFGILAPLYQLGYLRGVLKSAAPHAAVLAGLDQLTFVGSFSGAAPVTALALGFGLATLTRITRFDWERHAVWVLLGYPSLAFAIVYRSQADHVHSLLLGLMISPLVAMVMTQLYDWSDRRLGPLIGKGATTPSGRFESLGGP
jgi:hypothetical protein